MMGGAKAHYDGIVAFSQTDFTKDLEKITVLVMHRDDDQSFPTQTPRRCQPNSSRTEDSRPIRVA
jgi:hypothetical protein